jgi:hypothetical protein
MRIGRCIRWSSVVAGILFSLLLTAARVLAQDDPPGRVARLSYEQGTVSLQTSGANDWSQASLNYPLSTGDRIYTDQDSRAELDLGNIAIQLSATTDLTVANLNDQFLQLGIGQGTIRVRVFDLPEGNSVEVDTPNGALTLVRPGDYRVEAYPDDNTTLVSAYRGSLEINGGDFSQSLDGGQAVKLTGTDPIAATLVSLPRRDDFDKWCESRNQRYQSSDSARYVGRNVPGYHDLDDHGRWVQTSEYGPVWYPGDVPPNWAPYRYGRWIWDEPWGWTWVDDAPWGFTPFHYGRWARLDSRWCWVPGHVEARWVYAPALVAFVGGRNFGIAISIGQGSVQAWFPLGPREPYYPWYHHDDDYLRRVNVTNVTNITNITNVTNINNIQYANRNSGTTAVPASTLRDGQPVSRQIIRVSPQQIAQAQVIAHPTIAPSAQATVGGKPVAAPPIPASRIFTPPANGRVQPGNTGVRPGQPPVITRTPPTTSTEPVQPGRPSTQPPVITGTAPTTSSEPGRPSQPPVISRTAPTTSIEPAQPPITPTAPGSERGIPGNNRPAQPRMITRTPPPPPNPPFEQRQPALQQHPGRPLEPQQMNNIREGRSAGPMRDREVPPHPQAAPQRREKPSPPSDKSTPRSKEDKKPK